MGTVEAPWRKSSYSGGNGGNCVEVGSAAGVVLVRDTADPDGQTLLVTPGTWHAFLETLER
ncbi:MAG: DUF397 domain-containing protein [Trebonia sp.]